MMQSNVTCKAKDEVELKKDASNDNKRRVKQEGKRRVRDGRCEACITGSRKCRMGNSRLGAGLGAAGLASGFAASHFEGGGCEGGRTGCRRCCGEMACVGVVERGVGKMDEGRSSGRARSL
jgi:hypothetical protein